ncbi:MAG TPA: Fe-S oxidoreductase [Gammaproteobacteria bacterium]|nr:Fe-S oxidoreductase [Gammaproteobacteria bacterium]
MANQVPEERRRGGKRVTPVRPVPKWDDPAVLDQGRLYAELERVFDICHGCRRCASLCPAFNTLFELIDGSSTMGLDGLERGDYWRIVDLCHLCGRCYTERCPFVPPHRRNVDFPLLMLRARVVRFRGRRVTLRDRLLASPDRLGRLAAVPLLGGMARMAANSRTLRRMVRLSPDERLPAPWVGDGCGRRTRQEAGEPGVVLFATCSGSYGGSDPRSDLCAVLEHNSVAVAVLGGELCCGMARLQLGDLERVDRARRSNVPLLAQWVERGWSIVTTEPACLQLFRYWLPLLFPADQQLRLVADAMFDPFEYLLSLHREGRLNTTFVNHLGVVSCHLPCRVVVQDDRQPVVEVLGLVPGTHVELLGGCCGCAGGYSFKEELHHLAREMAGPMARRIRQVLPDHYGSTCPAAGRRMEHLLADGSRAEHPLSLLRLAYGI